MPIAKFYFYNDLKIGYLKLLEKKLGDVYVLNKDKLVLNEKQKGKKRSIKSCCRIKGITT